MRTCMCVSTVTVSVYNVAGICTGLAAASGVQFALAVLLLLQQVLTAVQHCV